MREASGPAQTAALSMSIVAHAVVLTALVLMPGLLPKSTAPEKKLVMTISLGGTPGPKISGMTSIGGRTITAAAPSVAPKVERVALPTPKPEPAMVMPVPDPKLRPKTPAKPEVTSKDPKGVAGARGAETQKGSATVETGVRGMGFGLSNTGGGGAGGMTIDTQNFCCPEYLNDMKDRITKNWVQQQQFTGVVVMKFTILRNGSLTDISLEKSSNVYALDAESQRALVLTQKLAPLPGAYPDDHLTVHLSFEYQRK
jgi:TonB family protein